MEDQAHHDHHHTHQDLAEPPDYEAWIAAQRHGKDDYFKRSGRSPIPGSERPSFSGLAYYPVDASMRFESLRPEPFQGSTRIDSWTGWP